MLLIVYRSLTRHKKKTWTTYFVNVLSRYRQTPNSHLRVKAHAIGVSILAFTLDCSFKFGEFGKNKNLSGRFYFVYFYIKYYVTIGILFWLVILSAANIRKKDESSKQIRKNLQKT